MIILTIMIMMIIVITILIMIIMIMIIMIIMIIMMMSCHILPFQPILSNIFCPSGPVKAAKSNPQSISEGGRIWQVRYS